MNKVECVFESGLENYTYTGPHKEFTFTTPDEKTTVITTYVTMTSGCHIDDGFATVDNNNVTLTYTSWDNDEICFEQYSCEISFAIATASLPKDAGYMLNNVHDSRPAVEEILFE